MPGGDTAQEPAQVGDRRAARRRDTKAEILEAAWELVRRDGLAGLTMRELGRMVGMRAQSIYSYFESKTDIYDAMFRQGYLDFEAHMNRVASGADEDPGERARHFAHQFFAFCTADPVRYQLLFQRTIPDFEPSTETYALARRLFDQMTEELSVIGLTTPEAIDTWTAVLTGFTDQQISNEPGGKRWEHLLDRAVDMVVREFSDEPRARLDLTASPTTDPTAQPTTDPTTQPTTHPRGTS
jgi:AcrR family transcriptional regulator